MDPCQLDFYLDPHFFQNKIYPTVVVWRGVGKLLPVHQYSVDIFSYSGLSGILGSDGKQNAA